MDHSNSIRKLLCLVQTFLVALYERTVGHWFGSEGHSYKSDVNTNMHCEDAISIDEGTRNPICISHDRTPSQASLETSAQQERSERASVSGPLDPDMHRKRMWIGMTLPSDEMRKPPQEEREELLGYSRILFPHGKLRTITSISLAAPPQYLVDHQLQHRTYAPVLTDEEADQPCSDLGVEPMLDKLNELLETSYTLAEPGLSELIEDCIQRGYDFGMVYGRIRSYWCDADFVGLLARMEDLERVVSNGRRDAVSSDGRQLTRSAVPPRRVWDLYSNRVISYCHYPNTSFRQLSAVSHPWVHAEQRQLAETSINERQWPVPIPNDISLAHVRIELLNVGMVYCWLDVLCLRQEGKEAFEDVRKEEWKVDVPTIGRMYEITRKIATYYNGLGRPFITRQGDLSSERHWLNRAWTVQERSSNSLTVGLCPSSPKRSDTNDPEAARFFATLDETITAVKTVLGAILIMRRCHSTKEVDKIAGLAFLYKSSRLPVYSEAQSPEDAWESLIECMGPSRLTLLLFQYPQPGTGRFKFVPAWEQVMKMDHPYTERFDVSGADNRLITVDSGASAIQVFEHCHWDSGLRLDSCTVQHLSHAETDDSPRIGTARYMDCLFKLVVHHHHEINDGQYTLVGAAVFDQASPPQFKYIRWIIATVVPGRTIEVDGEDVTGILEKVSMACTEGSYDDDLWQRLEELGCMKTQRSYFL